MEYKEADDRVIENIENIFWQLRLAISKERDATIQNTVFPIFLDMEYRIILLLYI